MVRCKGPRSGSARNGLQNRSLHLKVAGLIENAAHRAEYLAALDKDVAHALVHHKVHVALSVAQFGVAEGVVKGSVRVFFDGRKGAQRLAKQFYAFGMHADFAGLRGKHMTINGHKITQVEVLFEDVIVQGLVFARADFVAVHVGLNAARAVLNAGKRGLAHDALGHEPARDADLGVGLWIAGVAV